VMGERIGQIMVIYMDIVFVVSKTNIIQLVMELGS